MSIERNALSFIAVLCISASIAVFAESKANMLADLDPFLIGDVEFSSESVIPGKIDLKKVQEKFLPRSDEMSFFYTAVPNQYNFYLGKDAREALIDAAKKYLDDYSNHALDKKKDDNAYGKMESRFTWGGLTINAAAHPRMLLGYRFFNNSPYFTITIPDTPDELNPSATVVMRTGPLRLYFTSTQLEDFCTTLDYDTIKEAVAEMAKENKPDSY